MTRLLTIAADLSAPPSSSSCFRDVTLAGSIRGYEVVAVADLQDMLDHYNLWFKQKGLWDYVTDLITPADLRGTTVEVEIVGGADAKLTAHNIHETLRYIPK